MEKNSIGRPTKYNESILEKAKAYLDALPEDEVIHSIEGLADFLDIDRSTIYDWASQDDKEDFSYIVNKLLIKQGKSLINNTLNKKFEPRTANMILGKHGYTIKTESDVTSKVELKIDSMKELTNEELERITNES
jgi:hypothetical protein